MIAYIYLHNFTGSRWPVYLKESPSLGRHYQNLL